MGSHSNPDHFILISNYILPTPRQKVPTNLIHVILVHTAPSFLVVHTTPTPNTQRPNALCRYEISTSCTQFIELSLISAHKRLKHPGTYHFTSVPGRQKTAHQCALLHSLDRIRISKSSTTDCRIGCGLRVTVSEQRQPTNCLSHTPTRRPRHQRPPRPLQVLHGDIDDSTG